MEQENGKELEMQANTSKKYVRNPIHIYGPGEEWRSNPIHFSDSLEEMKERENPQFSHLEQENGKELEMQANTSKKYVRNPIHIYGPGEEWRSNPIHFSDSLEEMKERENPQFSHLNETVNGDTMSKEEKQEKTVTSPLHFSEKYGINADAEQEEAKRFEENDRRASENERQQKLEKKADTKKIPDMGTKEKTVTSPLHFSEKYGINADAEQEEAKRFEENDRRASENERQQKLEKKADTEKIPDMDTKEKEGVKKNVPACENSEKKRSTPIYFRGAHIRSNGWIEEVKVPDTEVGSVLLDSEIAEKILGANGVEMTSSNMGEKIQRLLKSENQRAERKEIANFHVIPVRVIQRMDRAGNKKGESEIICRINIYGKRGPTEDEFSIRQGEINGLMSIIQKKYPSTIIWGPGRISEIKNEFRQMISEIPEELYYADAGWNYINGKNIYIHKSMKENIDMKVDTELDLPVNWTIQPNEIPALFDQILNLYQNDGVSYTMLIYSFMGVLYKVFDVAGYAPHFLLFISGRTGSYKSAIAKVLYTQLCDSKHRKFPRRIDLDSESSLERGLVLNGQDTVTLIDDFAPQQTAQKKGEIKNKLETITRMVGDGSTKSRSNASLEDHRGEGFKGMITITGEIKGTGLSSNLRCIYLEIQKENVNTDILSWMQKYDKVFTTLIHHMTTFESIYWDAIVRHIKKQYEPYRKLAYGSVHAGRLADALVNFWLVVDIVDMFFRNYCGSGWNDERIKHVKRELQNVVVSNEEMSTDDDPAEVFMCALCSMLNNNRMELVSYEIREKILQDADGYETEGYYFMLPEKVYEKVLNWLRKAGKDLFLDSSQIIKVLGDAGYICVTSNGADKKIYYSRIRICDRRVKLLKISKAVVARVLEMDRL